QCERETQRSRSAISFGHHRVADGDGRDIVVLYSARALTAARRYGYSIRTTGNCRVRQINEEDFVGFDFSVAVDQYGYRLRRHPRIESKSAALRLVIVVRSGGCIGGCSIRSRIIDCYYLAARRRE